MNVNFSGINVYSGKNVYSIHKENLKNNVVESESYSLSDEGEDAELIIDLTEEDLVEFCEENNYPVTEDFYDAIPLAIDEKDSKEYKDFNELMEKMDNVFCRERKKWSRNIHADKIRDYFLKHVVTGLDAQNNLINEEHDNLKFVQSLRTNHLLNN